MDKKIAAECGYQDGGWRVKRVLYNLHPLVTALW